MNASAEYRQLERGEEGRVLASSGNKHRLFVSVAIAAALWIGSLVSLPWVAGLQDYTPGWDLRVYQEAITSVAASHDPYTDGLDRQQFYHLSGPHSVQDMPPYTYVYSPVTTLILRAVLHIPAFLRAPLYLLFYLAGMLAAIWAVADAGCASERNWLWYATPIVPYFPGLLQESVVFSGNIAYLLYGAVLSAAVWGWRRQRWTLFYALVLFASCYKAPLLSLLLIALFTGRRQFVRVLFTGAVGVALFAVQPWIWPSMFRHYLLAVELQFSYNHDFGLNPAGLAAKALLAHGWSYQHVWWTTYVCFALVVFGVLLILWQRFKAGAFPLERWLPLVLIGVVLLNPRAKTYDVAPVTVAILLILWRGLERVRSVWMRGGVLALGVMALNLCGVVLRRGHWWDLVEALLLCGCFAGEAMALLLHSSRPGCVDATHRIAAG